MASLRPTFAYWAIVTMLFGIVSEQTIRFTDGSKVDSTGCMAVTYAYEAMGFSGSEVPKQTISGKLTKIKLVPECCLDSLHEPLDFN